MATCLPPTIGSGGVQCKHRTSETELKRRELQTTDTTHTFTFPYWQAEVEMFWMEPFYVWKQIYHLPYSFEKVLPTKYRAVQ